MRSRVRRVGAPLMVLLASASLGALETHPGLPAASQTEPRSRHVAGLSVRGFRIVLDSTPIGAVASHFRRGHVVRVRGGTEGDFRLCYVLRDSASSAVLQLFTEDLGGSDQDIMWFTLERGRPRTSDCARLNVHLGEISIDLGITLGMSLQEFTHRIGPVQVKRDSAEVQFADSVLFRTEPDTTWIHFWGAARFRQRGLAYFEANTD